MIISDKIYGEFEISEPVLVDLINSRALQRLKGIAQFGPPEEFYHQKGFMRYEHSVGVFLLLRKLGASPGEQISGLLHDASHTAFSHVIDTVLGDPSIEDFQDKNHLERLLKSDIKPILEKYGIDIYEIADCESFVLLECNAPNLCADRIDYTLRELAICENIKLAKELANNLMIYDNKIIFKNLGLTRQFADIYLRYNREHWSGFEAVSRYYQLAQILKEAFLKKYLDMKDIWGEDKELIDKIYKSGDVLLITKLEAMRDKETTVRFGILHSKKFRYVDPQILFDDKVQRLSALDKNYADMLNFEKIKANKGMKI
ncbi:HD domain-containing protein [Candidatus Parcubacteria bacterium]|nr:HD domain-containing protein [Patescibacteria group bacterium]MCG2694243.1 HD domain-containing protein [Candidatus Parcubacteria bacterium]